MTADHAAWVDQSIGRFEAYVQIARHLRRMVGLYGWSSERASLLLGEARMMAGLARGTYQVLVEEGIAPGPLEYKRPTRGYCGRDGDWDDDAGPQGSSGTVRHRRWWSAAQALCSEWTAWCDDVERRRVVSEHSVEFVEDEKGFVVAECECGWLSPPCPDGGTAADFWGGHRAAEAGVARW